MCDSALRARPLSSANTKQSSTNCRRTVLDALKVGRKDHVGLTASRRAADGRGTTGCVFNNETLRELDLSAARGCAKAQVGAKDSLGVLA